MVILDPNDRIHCLLQDGANRTLWNSADGVSITLLLFHCTLGDVVIALVMSEVAGIMLWRPNRPERYLTSLGREAAEHAQTMLGFLTAGVAASVQ